MRQETAPAERQVDRFRNVLRRRVVPGLADLGFDPSPACLAAAHGDDVVWLLDVHVAPWSGGGRFCFALTWGVFVPGLSTVLDEAEPLAPGIDDCVVRGWAGQRDSAAETAFFELRDWRWPVNLVGDALMARSFLAAVQSDVLRCLGGLPDAAAVQRYLHDRHRPGRGYPGADELRSVRAIAALSLLLGHPANASRWLDHLAARSEAAMTPEVVAERLAPLRSRCLAS